MSEYWINAIARGLAGAIVALVVTFPAAFGVLWFARSMDVFERAGWPNPTNEQMILIALFVAIFSR